MARIGPLLTAFDSPHLSESNTGLGNVLFQISSTYGISKAFACEFNGRHLFEFTERLSQKFGFHHGETIFRNFLLHTNTNVDRILHESPNHHKLFDIPLLNRINDARDLSLLVQGYMESHLYFDLYENEIRKMLSIDDVSKKYLQEKYPFLFDSNKLKIAIHIRTGNSIVEIDEAYYKRAIDMMLSKYPTADFVLFTNDEKNSTVSYIISTLPRVHCIREREDYLEIWAFSLTDHAICCFSTFSWWGAYLIDSPTKTVIVPRSSVDYMIKTYNVDEKKILTEYYYPQYNII
jgi:hypothetical protein